MKRYFLTGAFLVLACVSALAQSPSDTVKIGVVGPFTGPSADFGVPMLNGVKLAVEEINQVGGYLGRKFELVVRDDKADPATGRAGAEDLLKSGVVAAIGFCNTGVAMKSIDVFQNAKVPLIVPCATGSPITSAYPEKDSYIFRTSPRDSVQAPFLAKEIVRRSWTKVAVFADKTAYGEAGLKDIEAALDSRGIRPVHVARFDLGVKDLSQELREARAAGANVLVAYTVGPENAVIAKGRQELKWPVPMLGPWTLSFPFFIDGAGAAAEGALMAQSFIAEPSNERRATFLASYRKSFNAPRIPVPMAAAQAYDSTYLLAYALLNIRDGKLSGPVIKTALENQQRVFYGVVATYERAFSPSDKNAIDDDMLVLGLVRHGQVTFAYPEDSRRNLLVQHKRAK